MWFRCWVLLLSTMEMRMTSFRYCREIEEKWSCASRTKSQLTHSIRLASRSRTPHTKLNWSERINDRSCRQRRFCECLLLTFNFRFHLFSLTIGLCFNIIIKCEISYSLLANAILWIKQASALSSCSNFKCIAPNVCSISICIAISIQRKSNNGKHFEEVAKTR